MKAVFEPKEDITAYELARIVANLVPSLFASPSRNVTFTQEKWDNLTGEIKRHFRPLEV